MKKLICLFALIFLNSCSDTCKDAVTGPPGFLLEIVSADTNINVFASGIYTESQVTVTSETETPYYNFISENNGNVIEIFPAWRRGTFTTFVKLNDEVTIPIVTKIVESSDDCNTSYFIGEISFTGFGYQYDAARRVYTVKI